MSIISLVTVVFFAGVCSASPVSRIVNGTPTSIEAYPSIVQVEFFNPTSNAWSQNCGGTILNQIFILSGAFCTDARNDPFYSLQNRRIRAGATIRNTGGVIGNLAGVTIHPDYNVNTFLDADIVLIRLSSFLPFGPTITSSAIIPSNFIIPDNAPVIHVGWGTVGDESTSEELLFANLVHRSSCDGIPEIFLTEYKICASSPINAGACGGDTGGPMFYGGVLAGVMSRGPTGCDTSLPTISAKVSSFTNWILENAI